MSDIKLVATDMDGTLLNGAGELPADFMEWVRTHPEILVVPASGRQVYALLETFEPIKEQLTFIADNGSIVYEGGEIIYTNVIDDEAVRETLRILDGIEGADPIVCGIECAYASVDVEDEVRNDLAKYYARRAYLEDLNEVLERDRVIKMAVHFGGGTAERRFDEVNVLPKGLKAVVSGPNWIDIANESVNKGVAIRAIQEAHGFAPEECMAFGDYQNDLELLKACGESYAMANAHDDVKAIAKYIAASNNEDGVMQVLRKL